jgi:hypothetical protein
VRIRSAVLAGNGSVVTLNTTPLSEDTVYTIRVQGVLDRSKARNAASGSVQFRHQRFVPGLHYTLYEQRPKGDELEHFAAMTPATNGVATRINLSMKRREQDFSIRFDGLIRIPASGDYTFFTSSDDGSRLYIGGKPVVRNDGMHGTVEKSGTTTLRAGTHAFTVTFYQGSGPCSLTASWSGPDIAKQVIPGDVLFHIPFNAPRSRLSH